jgi:hypothetical protein
MSYDFLGVAHRYQWDALKAFVDNHVKQLNPTDPKLSTRRSALLRKIDATRRTVEGVRACHAMLAGEMLPYYNRAKDADGNALYRPNKPNLQGDFPMLTDEIGERPIPGQAKIEWLPDDATEKPADMYTARLVSTVKAAFLRQIQWKKERLEYRQRRLYDQIDLLYKELVMLEDLWPITSAEPRPIDEFDIVDSQFNDRLYNGTNLFDGNEWPHTERGLTRRLTPEIRELTEG